MKKYKTKQMKQFLIFFFCLSYGFMPAQTITGNFSTLSNQWVKLAWF